jgi:hypothetical protein
MAYALALRRDDDAPVAVHSHDLAGRWVKGEPLGALYETARASPRAMIDSIA